MVNPTCMNSAQSILLEYQRCQDPYHVLGRAFMFQRLILIFIERFSAKSEFTILT